jgi:hypothetical protein
MRPPDDSFDPCGSRTMGVWNDTRGLRLIV